MRNFKKKRWKKKKTKSKVGYFERYYTKLSDLTKKEESLQQSHSIDEAHELHDLKKEMERELKSKGK